MRHGWLVLALAALALCGCETTAETSARLEREAKRQAGHAIASRGGLAITHPSTVVKVIDAVVLHSAERTAAAVTLHNTSSRALRAVPIAITIKNARGASVYDNSAPGLTPPLVSASYLPAHGELTWVDDQVTGTGASGASSVIARVGEGTTAGGTVPPLKLAGVHVIEDPAAGPGAEGMVVNASATAQQELVIYGVAHRAGKLVAAGRAILPEAPAHQSSRFQLYFVGDPHGAALSYSAPASTLSGG